VSARQGRVSADDLDLAATWLEAYEASEDDTNGETLARVAAWIRAEVVRRRTEATVHQLAITHGVTPAAARRALRKAQGDA
jgi:hypothetical protein